MDKKVELMQLSQKYHRLATFTIVGFLALLSILLIIFVSQFTSRGQTYNLSLRAAPNPTKTPGMTGSGAPKGQHYNLNIIGVTNPKTTPMTDSKRHTIFVPLFGTCGIGLTQTPNWSGTYNTSDFQVLDGNCFDDGLIVGDQTLSYKLSAGFQLPPPDPTGTGTLQYTVFVKVTSPKGSANMSTCFYDPDVAETYCNTGYTLSLSKADYPKFSNVSKNLLTVCAFVDDKWQLEPLFFDSNSQYWWELVNNGLQKVSLRFYPNTQDNSPYLNTNCTGSTR